MYTTPLPPAEYLNQCFEYKPDGTLIWKYRPISHFSSMDVARKFNNRYFGKEAGSVTREGYLKIGILYKNKQLVLFAHRIIWAMHKYPIPEGLLVDHRNHNTLDNRIENLRLATDSQNQCNRLLGIDNTSGIKGISFHKKLGKWVAQIQKDNKNMHIGVFHYIEDAQEAVRKVRLQLHEEFTHHGE